MKKFAFCFTLLLLTMLSLAGCGSNSDEPVEAAESSSLKIVETTESTEHESTSVNDPDLVWKYDSIENTVEPKKNMISADKVRNNANIMELWISTTEDFENAGVVIYADGEQVGYMPAAERFLDRSFTITTNNIEEGVHSAEIVQYEDPYEPKKEEIIFYVRTTYELK